MAKRRTAASTARGTQGRGMVIETAEPAIEVQEVAKEERGAAGRRFWPADKPLPGRYRKRRPQPCPKCRRVLTEVNGQAVVCTNSGATLAWFRCRCCEHRWCLPVEEE